MSCSCEEGTGKRTREDPEFDEEATTPSGVWGVFELSDLEIEFEFEFEFADGDGDTIVFVIGISPGDSLSPSTPFTPFVPVLIPLPRKNR